MKNRLQELENQVLLSNPSSPQIFNTSAPSSPQRLSPRQIATPSQPRPQKTVMPKRISHHQPNIHQRCLSSCQLPTFSIESTGVPEPSWPASDFSLFPPWTTTGDSSYACSTSSMDGYSSTDQYDDMLAPIDNNAFPIPSPSSFTFCCSACGNRETKSYAYNPSPSPSMGLGLEMPGPTPDMDAMGNWIVDRDLRML
jgi:hypothetical protein